MLSAATIGVLLALAPGAAPSPSKTLWVVQSLYPGQELLVTRTEEALRKLMSGSQDQLIGSRALSEHLTGRKADLRCLTGDVACTDPIDAFVGSLGLQRVVMLKGGQEDAAYRYKAVSYVPATGETAFAEGAGAILDRALLAALVKVVPLASTLEITSEPSGSTVFIDGEKVGVTPFSGQILPGERVVKVETASHMPSEKRIEVPVRGRLQLNETLEKVPARIVITAGPAGTSISIDGAKVGLDKVDRPIQPGRHRVELGAEGHASISEEVDVTPGATVTLDRTLSATGWTAFKTALNRAQEPIYKRGSSLSLSYEWAQWHGNALYAKSDPTAGDDTTDDVLAEQLLERSPLHGLSLEYSQDGRYFGLMVVGAAWYRSNRDWRYTLANSKAHDFEQSGRPMLLSLRALQPHVRIAFWRFMLYGQAGFEARGLLLQPRITPGALQNEKDLWVVDALLDLQLALRAFVVEGLFLEGSFRYGMRLFQSPASLRGFHVGLGYAF